MGIFKPVTFFRFLFFYTLGSSPYVAPAFGIGYLTSFMTDWGWAISAAMLSAYFSYQIAAEISWSKGFIARESGRSESKSVNGAIEDHKRVSPYVVGSIGAVIGWVTGEYAQQYSAFVVYVLFCVLYYFFERWRSVRFA